MGRRCRGGGLSLKKGQWNLVLHVKIWGPEKKIQKCGWFESGEEQEVSKVGGWEAAGSKYPSNGEALFGRELSSSGA